MAVESDSSRHRMAIVTHDAAALHSRWVYLALSDMGAGVGTLQYRTSPSVRHYTDATETPSFADLVGSELRFQTRAAVAGEPKAKCWNEPLAVLDVFDS